MLLVGSNPTTRTIIGCDYVTGIYKITSKDTGKCYIGQSIDIENRWI